MFWHIILYNIINVYSFTFLFLRLFFLIIFVFCFILFFHHFISPSLSINKKRFLSWGRGHADHGGLSFTPLQARSRAVSASVAAGAARRVKLTLSGVRVRCPPLQHASPPADMGCTRSEWTLTAGSAAASVRVVVSVSRGNPAARVWAFFFFQSTPSRVYLPVASFMDNWSSDWDRL